MRYPPDRHIQLGRWLESQLDLAQRLQDLGDRTASHDSGRESRACGHLPGRTAVDGRPPSKLIQALDHIWNAELSKLPEVVLVVCGSAASWMIDNLIHAKGGLHNRITRQIRLAPFSFPETIAFLQARQVKLGLEPAAELYMAIGGYLII